VRGLGRLEVDLRHLQQREVALAFLGRADAAGDGIAGAQIEAPDLAGRDVDVIRAGEIGGVLGAQEAITILQDFQDAVAIDLIAVLGNCLEHAKNHILLT